MRTSFVLSSFALVLSIAAVACGSSGDGHGDPNHPGPDESTFGGDPKQDESGPHVSHNGDSTSGEQVNEQCGNAKPTQTKGEGEACDSALDCAPSCCKCANSTSHWSGARCVAGKCSSLTVCDDLGQISQFCK